MKKHMIVLVALGILGIGTMTASAAESRSNCASRQAMQQYTRQTAELRAALTAKDSELAQQNSYGGIERGYDGPDPSILNQLQHERREIKDKIDLVARENGLRPCCL